jgi:Uma2 family endonuclease
MVAQARPERAGTYTEDEYLTLAAELGVKLELLDGQLFVMTGGSALHARIASRFAAALLAQVRGPRCLVCETLRVRTPSGAYLFPDVVATCDPVVVDDEPGESLTNPRLVVEVLSRSTESRDRDEKFAAYRSCVTLIDYVLVRQDDVLVEQHSRQLDDRWQCRMLGPGERLVFPSLGFVVDVDEIYRWLVEPRPR